MGQGAGISRAYVAEGAKVVIADVAKDEGHGIYKKQNIEAVRATEVLFLKKVLGAN